MTDLPFSLPEADPTAIERPPRKCVRHDWAEDMTIGGIEPVYRCARCGAVKDPARSRRNRNNGRRGRSDELTVARLLGGEKVGQLNLPWDVVVPGYLRAQAKQLDS